MQCLVVAVRPLRVEELAEVLAFDFNAEGIPRLNPSWRWEDQKEAVMSACSSLVMIAEDGDSRIVQFSHFSVKEYLTSDRLGESSKDVSRYQIVPEAAHTIVAQACLGVLLGLDGGVDREKVKSFPLAEYAAQHWHLHAQFENVSSRIEEGMKWLFDGDEPHFATWLWIYNGDDFHDRPMTTMRPEKPAAVPLYHAARLGFRALVEHLISKHPDHLHARGGSQITPLHALVSPGHTAVLLLLIEHFPDVDIRGYLDQTPLHRAAFSGQVEIGQVLLSRGADINAIDLLKWTPLHGAAITGRLEFTRMLLAQKAGISTRDYLGQTPPWKALNNGNIEVVPSLRDYFQELYSQTAVHQASTAVHSEIGRGLLSRGADVDARDRSGWTPLYWAANRRNLELARVLLEHGARVDVPSDSGRTPLITASSKGQIEIVRLLLEYGADPQARDNDGETPSQVANGETKQEIMDLLSKYIAESVKH